MRLNALPSLSMGANRCKNQKLLSLSVVSSAWRREASSSSMAFAVRTSILSNKFAAKAAGAEGNNPRPFTPKKELERRPQFVLLHLHVGQMAT